MERISWSESVTNKEKKKLIKDSSKKEKMFNHQIDHDNFIRSIIKGKTERKRGRGRPSHCHLDKIRGQVNVVSYQEIKIRQLKRGR